MLLLSAGAGLYASGQVSIAAEGGLNVSQLLFSSDGYGYYGNTSARAGAMVGGMADIRLSRHFYVQPGLYYLMTGCNFSDGGYLHVNTFEIPILLVYKFGHIDGGRFFIAGGPYFAYNISGTVLDGGTSSALRIGSATQDASGGGDDLRAMDFGLASDFGFQFRSGFYIRARSQTGLTNLNPPNYYDESAYATSFSLTVGYIFGGHNDRRGNAANRRFYRK